MSSHSRRTFLRVTGGVLGGIFAGSTVVAAERTDRFVVRTRGGRTPSDLEVIHALPGVPYAVVEASERAVAESSAVADYAPDLEVRLDDPAVNADAPTAAEADEAVDEPLYPLQWDKQSQGIPAAHDVTRGEGTRVAVIDSGVAAGHPDLQHAVNVGLSRNFSGDEFGVGVPAGGYHGTHVAGIVAASGENDRGVVGTAPAAEIVDCRVFAAGVAGASFGSVLAAMLYAASVDCDVANLSLGAYPISRKALGSFYGKALNSTMTYVVKEGTLLSIAAGNDAADLQHDGGGVVYVDGDDEDTDPEQKFVHAAYVSLPNEGAGAVSVAATGPIGFAWDAEGYGGEEPPIAPAVYTNYGTNAITVAAPGGNYSLAAYLDYYDLNDETGEPKKAEEPPWYLDLVLNAIAEPEFRYEDGDDEDRKPDDDPVEYLGATYGYSWVAGTSMAAPQVAGAAALVKSVNPGYNAKQVEDVLRRTATVPDGYDKAYYGAGVIHPNEAVRE